MKITKILNFLSAIAVTLALVACADEAPLKDEQDNTPTVDVFEYFPVHTVDSGANGFDIVEPMVRIYNSNGDNLLDEKFPGNVRDNQFQIEYGDSIIRIEEKAIFHDIDGSSAWFSFYPTLHWYKTCLEGDDDQICIGHGSFKGKAESGERRSMDITFYLIWPERDLRYEIRYVHRSWNTSGKYNWQIGVLLDGKPQPQQPEGTIKIIVD